MAQSGLAIVIPALNEARTIANVIAPTLEYGSVIVVDNGSTDGTGEAAIKAGADLIHLTKPGYDAALSAGFEYAERLGFDVVLTMDADGQHDPEDIPVFLKAIDSGYAIVYGIRSGPIRIMEQIFSWATTLAWDIRDPWCGMKAYRMTAYRKRGCFDSSRSIGAELLLFAARSRMPVTGVCIRNRERFDRPRFGGAVQANLTLLGASVRALIASGRRNRKQLTASTGENR